MSKRLDGERHVRVMIRKGRGLELKIINKSFFNRLIWRKIDSNYHILYCKYNRLPIIIFPLINSTNNYNLLLLLKNIFKKRFR